MNTATRLPTSEAGAIGLIDRNYLAPVLKKRDVVFPVVVLPYLRLGFVGLSSSSSSSMEPLPSSTRSLPVRSGGSGGGGGGGNHRDGARVRRDPKSTAVGRWRRREGQTFQG